MPSLRLSRSLIAIFLAATAGFADLKWSGTEAVLDIDSSQSSGTAKFEFVNDGKSPVTIAKVEAGCGCTVPTLEKREYAAGESGSFTARFTVGERRGVYRIPIHVQVEGGEPAELSLVVQIRELVKYFPTNLTWASGEARKPKDIELHWDASEVVKITSIRNINPEFKAELVPEHDWNGALIRVTPAAGDKAATTVVLVKTAQGPDRHARTYTVVARAQ